MRARKRAQIWEGAGGGGEDVSGLDVAGPHTGVLGCSLTSGPINTCAVRMEWDLFME